MKGTVRTIIIGFISGIAGAFFFQLSIPNNETGFLSLKNKQRNDQNELQLIYNNGLSDVSNSSNHSYFPPENIDFVTASKVSTQSVVYVKTISETSYASSWMDYFFGDRTGQTISSGSGVIYTSDGYIITNNHVIDNADQIEVNIGKKSYAADVVGTDPSTDLAVLKIEATGLKDIQLSTSKKVNVGDWVLAVGNPFNLTSTVTAGIVSAKGRELNILKSTFPLESFIQTDAAINPGNSGGALVNLNGELIGINTAILSRTGSYAGYGFAVPSDIVKKVADDIIKFGIVQKAFFGGEVLDIDSDIAKKLNLDNFNGVVLSYVQQNGGAEKAGLQKGDVILSLDNDPIESRSEFEELISYFSPGDQINVVYKRNNKTLKTVVSLTNKEGTTELLRREIFTSNSLNADFEKVSKVERDMLNIEHGVRVLKVRNGLIKKMGLSEGFIVCFINKIPIKSPEELSDILEKIRGRVYVEGVNKKGQWEYHRYYF